MSALIEGTGRGDVILHRDATNRWGVEWKHSVDGVTYEPKDMTGWTGILELRSQLGEVWKRLPVTSSANGVTVMTVTPDDLADPAWASRAGGSWLVTVTAPDGHTERLADGYFLLEAGTVTTHIVPEPEPEGEKIPVGTVNMWLTGPMPDGWLPLDGRTISRTEYAVLFTILGTTYGPGDGATTFALPNLRGRVPVGIDPSQPEFDAPGRTGGTKTHQLTVSELAKHSHTDHFWNVIVSKGASSGTWPNPGPGTYLKTAGEDLDYPDGRQTGDTGEGRPFSLLQPYLALHFMIRAK